VHIKKREWESVSGYSKRVSATCIPDGGRRVKIAKSAAFRYRPQKREPERLRIYRRDALERYLELHDIPNPFKKRVIK
jgi:hypothetical protein